MTDLSRGLEALLYAIPDYLTAEAYYAGTTEEIFTTAMLERRLARTRLSHLRINLAKTPVDAVCDRLEVAGVSSTEAAAQTMLDTFWETNELDMELPNLFLKAGMFGDAYFVLDGDDQDGIELFYNSPVIMRMMYAEENPREKDFAIKRWLAKDPAGRKVWRLNLIYDDRIERYTTVPNAKGVKPNEFVPYFDQVSPDVPAAEMTNVIDHGFDFLPVYHFRAGARPYGQPEHKAAYGPQDAVNKLAITHLASVDYLGFPQRYALSEDGEDATEVDDFDQNIYHDEVTPEGSGPGPDLPASATVTAPATAQPKLTADPGGLWWLNRVKQVGQFTPADSANFLDSMAHYIRVMAQTTTTPLHYFDPSGEVPSGESLKTADAPLVKKAGNRKLTYGAALKDCFTDALSVMGITAEVAIHWTSSAMVDDKASWDVAAIKLATGVPLRQVLVEQGYTNEQLDGWGVPESQYRPLPAPPTIPRSVLPTADQPGPTTGQPAPPPEVPLQEVPA